MLKKASVLLGLALVLGASSCAYKTCPTYAKSKAPSETPAKQLAKTKV